MQKDLGLHTIESAVKFYENHGFNVHVRSGNGPVVLAITGGGILPECATMPFGIKRVDYDNSYFNNNHDLFVEAWQYIQCREQKPEKQIA